MDYNTLDKLSPNYNIVQQQQNQFTLGASSVEKPKYEVIQHWLKFIEFFIKLFYCFHFNSTFH